MLGFSLFAQKKCPYPLVVFVEILSGVCVSQLYSDCPPDASSSIMVGCY